MIFGREGFLFQKSSTPPNIVNGRPLNDEKTPEIAVVRGGLENTDPTGTKMHVLSVTENIFCQGKWNVTKYQLALIG